MNGKVVMSAFLAAALIFGAALWYFQTYAYYREVTGLVTVEVGETEVAVGGYRGIDSDTSPNKLRGCFEVDPAAFADVPLAEDPQPLSAPSWFDCFDAEAIAKDLEAGRAVAHLVGDETPDGAVGYEIQRMIAVYPDGRAYLWRHYRESE